MNPFISYLKIIISGIIVNLTSLLPRNRKMMVFGAWFGQKYDDNSRALFEYVLNNRKDIHAYWITANEDVYKQMLKRGLPVYINTSRKAKWLALRTMYYISVVMFECRDSGGNLAKFMGGAKIINCWHGIPFKKIGCDDATERRLYYSKTRRLIRFFEKWPYRKTYHIATSPCIVDIYKRCFLSDDKHVLNLGQARNDYFYTNHINSYRERFGGRKIILYMPTHRHEGKQKMDLSILFDLKNIDEICKRYNAVFLVKKHFFHLKEKPLQETYENIIDITPENPSAQELLDAADVMVTDYSSCWIDYLLLDRPVLFYSFDLNDYLTNDREMYFDYQSVVPGAVCTNKIIFSNELENILGGHDSFAEKRAEVRNLFYSKENQQKVSEKQINTILNL